MRERKSKKPITVRLLSLLLTAVMLVTAQGFTAFAETVSQDDMQNVFVEGEAGEEPAQGVEDEEGGNIEIGEAESEFEAQTERAVPTNPVHHCTGGDFTDWSYIYFGSYPQSEVKDTETIASIEEVIAAGNIEASADTGEDVLINGTKYRRISKNNCNNTNYFDKAENNGYRYFKWERIKWRVLDNNDNGSLFVMADSALDCECYNNEDTTWENSTIRSWLNGSFYQMAFSSAEQSAIEPWHVVNEDNSAYGTKGGNDTTDHVYLLSIGEVTDKGYGFCSGYEMNPCEMNSISRHLKTSEYAYARGARRDTSREYEGNCLWWLRSPGSYSDYAAFVYDQGYPNTYGCSVDATDGGVVPALHINLSSELWRLIADDGSSEVRSIPEAPIHHCAIADYTDFGYIYFGSYPQSEVRDSATIAAIDSAIVTSGMTADAGIDVWVNGTKYRRIRKTDTNYNGCFDEVENNGCRYFKWERIKWRVLDNNNNGTLFVVADKALDGKNYNDYSDEYVSITWENSTIRSWLNDIFYQTAFSSEEQNAIKEWNVINEDNFYCNTEGGNDTIDHVYLLSIEEVTNESYGLCSSDDTYSSSRWLQTSEYAHARGAWRNISRGYEGNCWWWLRSPGNVSYSGATVTHTGAASRIGLFVAPYSGGVVPVLHINLTSDLWSVADDDNSGEGGGTSTGGNQNPSNPDPVNPDPANPNPAKPDPAQPDPANPNPANPNPANPDPAQPAAPQSTGTSLTASQVTSRTDTIPQGASFTVTSSDSADPTVCFDGVSDENAAVVAIPKTITYKGVEYKVTTVSPTAFSTKKDNASFTVTDNSVENLTVEYKAPSDAKKTKVTVPETTTYKGIKFKVTSVAAKSFKNNKKVKQVSIAGSVTKIGDSSFEGCGALKSVTLGKGTATIGKNAFKNCKKLTKITIKSTKLKTVGKNALKGVNAKCEIKVPAKQLKKYQKLFKKKGQKNSVKLVK